MGKWAEVHCSCPNRVPVENSDGFFDRPHPRKQRLTKRQQQEVQQWEQSRKNLFQCGHRKGLVIELWPGHIIQVGLRFGTVFRDAESAFNVFTRVGDWRLYEDELLLIEPDQAAIWLTEIQALSQALQGAATLPSRKTAKVVEEFARLEIESPLEKLKEALTDAARLCRASMETRNPIRLML